MELHVDRVEAYRATYPHTKAWDDATVRRAANKLMERANIRHEIKRLQKAAGRRNQITVDRVLKEETSLSFLDPGELLDENGTLIPINELPEFVRRAIIGFEAIELPIFPEGSPQRYKWRYKFSDKGKSLERVGKHLGLFEKDNKQKSFEIHLKTPEPNAPPKEDE
jgi:phage terminase small subunit